MLQVTGFVGTDKVVSVSPFCVKLDVYLRMSGLEYRYVVGDPRKSPTGKLPYLEDGDTLLSDSQLIVEYLEKTYQVDLDAGLSARDRALAHLIRRTVEESFYFHQLYANWVDPFGWDKYRPVISAMLPRVVRPIAVPLIRRSVRRTLHYQGTSRHSRETVITFAQADLAAVAGFLGEQVFMLGAQPRFIDVVCFSFLEVALHGPETMTTELVREHANLVGYCDRMRARYSGPDDQAGEIDS